ncbi:unnamed protein product [Musa textilis]
MVIEGGEGTHARLLTLWISQRGKGSTSRVEFGGVNAPIQGNACNLGRAIAREIEEIMLKMSRFIGIPNLLVVGKAPTPNESSSKEEEHTVGGMLMWEEAIGLLIMTN